MGLSNSQLIMLAELETIIKKMKKEGAELPAIREKCIQEGHSHWLVTREEDQDNVIAAALYLYAMDEKQKKAMELLSEMIQP